MDKLQKHYYEQNKPDTRVTYDSIHMKFSRDNSNLSQKKEKKKNTLVEGTDQEETQRNFLE